MLCIRHTRWRSLSSYIVDSQVLFLPIRMLTVCNWLTEWVWTFFRFFHIKLLLLLFVRHRTLFAMWCSPNKCRIEIIFGTWENDWALEHIRKRWMFGIMNVCERVFQYVVYWSFASVVCRRSFLFCVSHNKNKLNVVDSLIFVF